MKPATPMPRSPLLRAATWSAFFTLAAALPAAGAARPAAETAVRPAAVTSGYRLAPSDLIRVEIYLQGDLTTTTRVDSLGRIRLPLVNEVAVAGQTVADAQTAIERAYVEGKFLRHPHVVLSIEAPAPRDVFVSGQVRSPGSYPVPLESPLTLLDLVSKAGGLADNAKGSAVKITRLLPGGQKQTFVVDVESQMRGKAAVVPMQLEIGDVVYVPERAL